MRKRFVSHSNLVITANENLITVKMFRKLFPEIPDTVFDDNNLASMNDWHPSRIFCAENALFLLANLRNEENKEIAGLTLFILIGTVMNCLLRGKNLSREEQLILGFTGLYGSLWAYSTYMSNRYNKEKQFIFTKNMVIHIANYFYGTIGVIMNVQDSFSIGRIGSICLEHLFGRIRRISNGENTHKRFVHAVQKLQIIDKFKDTNGNKIPYRWFDTGIVRRGTQKLEDVICTLIMLFMRDMFKKAGFICSRECAFYDMQDGVIQDNIADDIIVGVLEKIALKEICNDIKPYEAEKRWILHSSSLNLGRKKGRNILGRYQDQNGRLNDKIKRARKKKVIEQA